MARLNFDVDKKGLKEINDLQGRAKAKTRAELMRDALKLYDWYLKQQEAGNNLALIDKDRKVREVHLMI